MSGRRATDARCEAAARRRPWRGQARLARLWRGRWLVLDVLVLLGATRLALLVVPFRRLASALGPADSESPDEVDDVALAEARRIAWAIRAVSRRTPWPSTCFPQALTALILLRRRGIPGTLYLGAAFRPDGVGLEAHAWLRCGPIDVTGGRGDRRFATLARFGAWSRHHESVAARGHERPS